MPIPPLNHDGFLPEGIHDGSLDEIKSSFGWFGSSGKRFRLFQKLVEYVDAANDLDIISEIIVDGSFVTAKADPSVRCGDLLIG